MSEIKETSCSDDAYIKGLEYENEMLKTFINSSEAGMYVSDFHTGEILFANRKMAEMGGNKITADELIGHMCWDVINEGRKERCLFCPYDKLVAPDGTLYEPYTWEHHFKSFGLWLKITSQAITWTNGRLAHMATFHDITKEKKMQEQLTELVRQDEQGRMQRNLQNVLEYLPLPVRIVDVETTDVVYINKRFIEVFEYKSKADIIGRRLDTLLLPVFSDGTDARAKINEVLLAEDINVTGIEYISQKGKVIEACLTNCIIEYNGRKSSVGIITDLSEEKKKQRQLSLIAEREREANKLKSSFLSNMSHEIRTPMGAIIGLTEIELRKNPPLKTKTVYNKINTSAKNLLNIINDILDLSKIEAGKMELFSEEFDIEEVLSNALLTLPQRLESKHVEVVLDLSLDLPRYLVGDKTRLWQIIRNQLDNAAKFTAKGHIVLSVSVDGVRSTDEIAYIRFMISDTGNGMSEEQLQKVFLPYEQVYDETHMHYSGTGLGLPISKQICEMMGGELEIKSELGQGTSVIFTIPFVRTDNKALEKDEIESSGLKGLSILAADDSEVLLNMTGTLLKGYGAEFVAAHSGNEALEIINKRKKAGRQFDVVLLDYIMEGLDGVETAKIIRGVLPKESKIFIVTAYENLLDTAMLQKCGIDGVIEKPFIPTNFIKMLEDVITKKQDINSEYSRTHKVFSNTLVLVCEDNDINQEIAASMLGEFGIASVMASNGKEGIEVLRENPSINLVLMDLHMPIMDGYEATKIIRADSRYDRIPIISLTADAMVETVEKCSKAGINDFISKPIIFEDLYMVLKKWLV